MSPESVFRLLQALIRVGFVANRAYYNRKLPAPEQDTLEKQEQGGMGRLAELLALPALPGTAAYVANPAWTSDPGSPSRKTACWPALGTSIVPTRPASAPCFPSSGPQASPIRPGGF